jgi:hypothetical protein
LRTAGPLTFTGGAVDPSLLNNPSLADGRYTLTVAAGQVGGPNGALDGDGNGAGGDNFALAGDPAANGLFRLFGDADGNGTVDALDLFRFRQVFGTTTFFTLSPFDFDGNGTVDALDLFQFRRRFGTGV